MNCPKCGNSEFIKRGNRKSAKLGGKILQQYQCKKCAHTFVPKEEYEKTNDNTQGVEVKSPEIPLSSTSNSPQNKPCLSTTDVNVTTQSQNNTL